MSSSGLPTLELEALIRALAATGSFALRNSNLFANLNRRGDWDVLVRDMEEAEDFIVHHLGRPDRIARRSYVTSYYYLWGYIDLFPDWQWRGIRLLPTSALARGLTPGPAGLPCLTPAREALVVWFGNLLWSGNCKQRYSEAITEAARCHRQEFESVTADIFGRRLARMLVELAADGRPEVADRLAPRLRRAVTIRALRRRPLRVVGGHTRFLVAEARLRVRPPMPMIAVHNAERIAEAAEEAAALAWSGVAGVAVFDAPGMAGAPTILNALRLVHQYWGPIVRARAVGYVVLLERGQRPGPARLKDRLFDRVIPRSDLLIRHDDWPADALAAWMLDETRRRAEMSLRPGLRESMKRAGVPA